MNENDFEQEEIQDYEQSGNTEPKEIDYNESVSKSFVGAYVDKTMLLGRETKVVLKAVAKGKFRHNALIQYDNSEKWIDLNKTNWNFLIDKFGDKPKEWIGKQFIVTADKFEKIGKDNRVIRGIMVVFKV